MDINLEYEHLKKTYNDLRFNVIRNFQTLTTTTLAKEKKLIGDITKIVEKLVEVEDIVKSWNIVK